MSRAFVGHVCLDLLDTLSTVGPATAMVLIDETGVAKSSAYQALRVLHRRRYVSRPRRPLKHRAPKPSVYTLTGAGRRALAVEVALGAVPGVSRIDVAAGGA